MTSIDELLTIENKLIELESLLEKTDLFDDSNNALTEIYNKLVDISTKNPELSELYKLILLLVSSHQSNNLAFQRKTIKVLQGVTRQNIELIRSLKDFRMSCEKFYNETKRDTFNLKYAIPNKGYPQLFFWGSVFLISLTMLIMLTGIEIPSLVEFINVIKGK